MEKIESLIIYFPISLCGLCQNMLFALHEPYTVKHHLIDSR
jgi:hypothetical protein